MSEPSVEPTTPPAGPSLKQRLLRGGFWVVAGKVATAGATIVIASVLAKLLPQEELGAYFLGERLIWLVAMLSLLGMNTTVVRLVAESMGTGQPGRARGAVRFAYVVGGLGLLASLVLLLAGGGAWLAREVWDSRLLEAVVPSSRSGRYCTGWVSSPPRSFAGSRTSCGPRSSVASSRGRSPRWC